MARNITKSDRRRNIWQKSNGLCAHCGKVIYGHNQTIDHFIPKALGGTFDTRNLMPLCRECNKIRSTKAINPSLFYRYAKKEAIMDCLAYKREWRSGHKNALGEIL